MALRPINQLKRALELIEGAQSVSEARRSIEQAITAIERQPIEQVTGGAVLRGRSYFDDLLGKILDQVMRGESREALIENTLRALAQDATARSGDCYLVLEGLITGRETIDGLKIFLSEGIQANRLENFRRKRLDTLADSQLIRDVMIDMDTHEFLPINHLRDILYFGEFDMLIDAKRRGCWLCALPLPAAEAHRPSRMLVVLYPMSGSEAAPSLPRGALQEWRTLTIMRVAYEMLNHQLSSTAERVVQERRNILKELAPGLVNHEINQQLRVLDESTNVINWALRKIEPSLEPDDANLGLAADGLELVLHAVSRLRRIADAFNNLERRPTQASVAIGILLSEVEAILDFRTAQLGAAITLSGDLDTQVVTDASLVEHVILNIISNALEAIELEEDEGPTFPTVRIKCTRQGETIHIDLMNNGPAINALRQTRIFEKGFTTKPRGIGHGLGLYNCRTIMSYLGGGIDILDSALLDDGFNAGFRLTLPVHRTGNDDVLPSLIDETRDPRRSLRST